MKQGIRQTILILALFEVMTFQACQKKDNEPMSPKKQLITTVTWKMTNQTTNPGVDMDSDGDVETNTYDYLVHCAKDDLITFKTNGDAEVDEGSLSCIPLAPQTSSWPWSFKDNETILLFRGTEYTLVELSATTLRLRNNYNNAGMSYILETTYGH